MTDIEKIKAEIERLKEVLASPQCECLTSDYKAGGNKIANTLRDFINSLPEEPVSEDLHAAALEHFLGHYDSSLIWNMDKECVIKDFKAGAQWQKDKMIQDAVGGYLIEDIEEGNGDFLLSADYPPASMGLKDRQKVKVIILKDE